MKIPDFVKGATNVYRTKNFIVKQRMGLRVDDKFGNVMVSHDVYYARTEERDKQYNVIYGGRKRLDGKRLPSLMYSRTYVE